MLTICAREGGWDCGSKAEAEGWDCGEAETSMVAAETVARLEAAGLLVLRALFLSTFGPRALAGYLAMGHQNFAAGLH